MDSHQALCKNLLFTCTRLNSDDIDVPYLKKLLVSIKDWQQMLNKIEINGLAPLFHLHLEHHSLALESNVAIALKALVLRHKSVSQTRYQAIQELDKAFNDASIPWVALKGLALASNLYAQVGHRPMRDMDILVPKSDLGRAAEIMKLLGYSLPEEQPSKYMRGTHQLPNAEKKINGFLISIEIHHNAIGQDAQGSLSFGDVISPIDKVMWGELSIPVLSKEQLLHQLCRHLEALHPGGNLKLINVIDVVGFSEKYILDLNWRFIETHYPHVLNTLACLHYIMPLSEDLKEIANIEDIPPLAGVGEIMQPLTTIFSAKSTLPEKLRLLLSPSDWWLHLYYGVKPNHSLSFVKFVRHPWTIFHWLLDRLISRILGG